MTALMRIGDEASVEAMLPYLRSQDAALRAAAIEALQALPEAIAPFMATLLSDGDSDVRLLATELARNMNAHGGYPSVVWPDRARAAPQRMRGGDRRAGGGRYAGGASGAGEVRRAFCRHAFSALRRSRWRSRASRARKARGDGRSEGRSVACRPYLSGGRPALLRISLSPHRHVVHESKRYFIDRRLEERIAATESSSFQAYFSLLRADADHEIEHLINSFTVNETYFYREDHQLRCMTSSLLGHHRGSEEAGRNRSASGRSRARPEKSPIPSPCG